MQKDHQSYAQMQETRHDTLAEGGILGCNAGTSPPLAMLLVVLVMVVGSVVHCRVVSDCGGCWW